MPVLQQMWTGIIPPQQVAIEFMTQAAYFGFNYQEKTLIDALFSAYWLFYMSGDVTEGLALWKRNYGVYDLEIDGVVFYYSSSELLNQYRSFKLIIGYQVGDRCPCRYRDGFNPPRPIC